MILPLVPLGLGVKPVLGEDKADDQSNKTMGQPMLMQLWRHLTSDYRGCRDGDLPHRVLCVLLLNIFAQSVFVACWQRGRGL